MSNDSPISPAAELLVDRQTQANGGTIVSITLNRPQALNSLTASLIRDLSAQLKTLAADTTLVRIQIEENSTESLVPLWCDKALCAF
jgi:hypothetical protein